MDYYDIFINHTCDDLCIKSAYTNVKFDEQNRFVSGNAINNIYEYEKVSPVQSIIRLEIPTESQINNNSGFYMEFGDNIESIYMVLVNNTFSKPKVLLPYGTLIKSSINEVSTPSFDVSSPYFLNTSDKKPFRPLHNDQCNYLLVQNTSVETDNNQDCILYTNKTIYSEGEVISVSYANLYSNFDTNVAGIEILIYRPNDVPGFTPSVDWMAVKYLDKNLGTSNTVYFPRDGERNVTIFTEGEYIIRMMYRYKDLCPPVMIKIKKPDKGEELSVSAPPTGSFRIYKLDKHINRISFDGTDSHKYLTIVFACDNRLTDLLVDSSFFVSTDRCIVEYIENRLDDPTVDYTLLLTSYIKSLMYNAFGNVLCNSVNNNSISFDNDPSRDIILQIKNYILHNIFEPITIETLANHFYFSKSHISHLFKEITGKSVNRYVSQARILKAQELLCKNDMSITEISQVLNYSDIHSFSHKFKKETGRSPTQFKSDYDKVYNKNKK